MFVLKKKLRASTLNILVQAAVTLHKRKEAASAKQVAP